MDRGRAGGASPRGRTAPGEVRPRLRLGWFIVAGLAVAAALALLVAPRASSSPDGLERVAVDEGFADRARDHALADGPTADYGVSGLDHEGLATGLAGLLGIAVTFAVAVGGLTLVRRAGPSGGARASGVDAAEPSGADRDVRSAPGRGGGTGGTRSAPG